MTGKTHASCGLLVGAWTTQYYQTDIFTTVTVMWLATMASLLPDICHMRSKIGRRLKLISFIIRLLFGHRTFTHSLIFVFLIASALVLIHSPLYYLVSIIGGLLSHVILDMLTPRGVQLFYPLPQNIHFPITVKTGGWMDLSLATALTVGAAYTLFQPAFEDFLFYIGKYFA
ncbi:metal-dependent hydrolase [Staphylococcus lugdunensis]|uniref:Metal-dependent hydrolase n=1 Tax=Staphylococcus lugdunensis TaxID=28035 RepID=A0A4Q9WFP1_STALU|nr:MULTISPECIES: metal-dependent hydrolase [Staphylococcus]AMG62416.1 hypothetical protein AL499_10745 [Staphylococcus lugdunensis]ARJ10946.1 hypothetical protein B7466_03835 [Staphylococcus lugdunensis]AST60601.1 hypothetical protein BFP67_07400 [Staphylococcus lugdunensis]ATG68363.1 hypothetical protein CPG32_01500 [Staphylococcus lugdunensis]ATN15912.1 hypothetical protein CRN64_10890 [Staphylococcus lugdunensis]